jgi:UDP-N-acetylglucosamine 2-epimerase (non-hydrolysing)
MRIVSVVGARPQFIKLAAVAQAMGDSEIDHIIVDTGQHYDKNLSEVFFDDLKIPAADVNLGIGSGTHGVQTGAMLAALDKTFSSLKPDCVLVYGDTNSTLAAALSAVKLHFPVAHLEAGLRSFNREMPEEHNRVLTDHASDLLMPPTQIAHQHLVNEGLGNRSHIVGDVMTDICYLTRDKLSKGDFDFGIKGDYLAATIHRAENTDDPERLKNIIQSLQELPVTVALLAHPRLQAKANDFGITLENGSVKLFEPLPYPQTISLMLGSKGVVTDSGGLQKEAYLLEVPCTTIRTETEWVETLDESWNVLNPTMENLAEVAMRGKPSQSTKPYYGDGNASKQVIGVLLKHFG